MPVSEKWGQGQPQPFPDPNLLPKIGDPAAQTHGTVPPATTPTATAKIWQPPNITVTMPEKMPVIGKPGQG